MARIETDPNYSTPTFPRATAATDLFKKEDVQQLAAAMSTHDHAPGKGVVLSANSIPTGSITSTHLANGTITSADIASGALATAGRTAGTTANPSTTSAALVVIPEMVHAFTLLFSSVVLITLDGTFFASVAGDCLFQLEIQSQASGPLLYRGASTAEVNKTFPIGTNLALVLAAGTYTARGLWAAQSGATNNALGTNRAISVTVVLA